MAEKEPTLPSSIHEAFPYLCVRDVAAAIHFYVRVFGAEEIFRLTDPGGRIAHAQLTLGPTTLLLECEAPELGRRSPDPAGSTSARVHLHVTNADALGTQAVHAGATLLMEPADQFYGERVCIIRDPFGHQWVVGHQIENMSYEEMQRRLDALVGG